MSARFSLVGKCLTAFGRGAEAPLWTPAAKLPSFRLMITSGRSESALRRVVAKSAQRCFLLSEKALPASLFLLFPLETLCWFLAGTLWAGHAKRLRGAGAPQPRRAVGLSGKQHPFDRELQQLPRRKPWLFLCAPGREIHDGLSWICGFNTGCALQGGRCFCVAWQKIMNKIHHFLHRILNSTS